MYTSSKISWRLSAAAGIDPPLHWALRFSHEDFGAQKLGDPPFFNTIFGGMGWWHEFGLEKTCFFFGVLCEKLMDNYESEIWVWYDLMGDGIACKIAGLQNLIICWNWWIQESSALQVAKLEDHLPAETAWTDNSHRKGMNPQCIRQKISRILKDVEIFRNLMRQLPNYICHRHPPH